MKTLSYFPQQAAMNSKPVMGAFIESAKQHYQTVQDSMDADVAVIWSCLWAGRMRANQGVYRHYRNQNKPVIIIEVGALKRNFTWKIAVNHITSDGGLGWTENLDSDRPRKLGITLGQPKTGERILVCAQHIDSLQLESLGISYEQWLQAMINTSYSIHKRPIVLRPHPRCPLNPDHFALVDEYQVPQKITGTYDDFNFSTDYYGVINFSSGPGIQAAIAGTPVIVDEKSLAHEVSNHYMDEQLRTFDREQWLIKLCHTEYTVSEIQQGTWYPRLEQWLKNT